MSIQYWLEDGAIAPLRATEFSAGWDLSALNTVVIEGPQPCVLIPTGVAFRFPPNYYGKICPRSGNSKKGLMINGGVIDSDFELPVWVMVSYPFTGKIVVNRGDRIAQIVFHQIYCKELEIGEKNKQENKHKGFGSTGGNV